MKRNRRLTLECKQISLEFLGRLPAHIILPLARISICVWAQGVAI